MTDEAKEITKIHVYNSPKMVISIESRFENPYFTESRPYHNSKILKK